MAPIPQNQKSSTPNFLVCKKIPQTKFPDGLKFRGRTQIPLLLSPSPPDATITICVHVYQLCGYRADDRPGAEAGAEVVFSMGGVGVASSTVYSPSLMALSTRRLFTY